MRTVEIEVYSIDELDNSAKDRAYHNWLEGRDYFYGDENKSTLEAFVKIFPVEVRDWSYGGGHGYVSFDFVAEEEIEELSGIRLLKYIYNNYFTDLFKGKYFSLWSKKEKSERNPNMGKLKTRYSKVLRETSCVLTGYYMDDLILEPIYNFLKSPNDDIDFRRLMERCFDNWVKYCTEDYENSISMDYFIEEMMDLGEEFLEDGSTFN